MIPGIVGAVLSKSAGTITATGGTIVTSGLYKYHTFTANGTFQITAGSGTIEVVAVGGGGSGGHGNNPASIGGGAGGGGGGQVSYASLAGAITSYAIVIGAGGAGVSASSTAGNNGTSSTFNTSTVVGAYGLGAVLNAYPARVGGASGSGYLGGQPINSGGGGGAGDTANGYNGQTDANGSVLAVYSGGGGGAGNTTYTTWATATSTGVSGAYAGGGGGAAYYLTPSNGVGANGGSGGGGHGQGYNDTAQTSGTTNTGAGGGGANDRVANVSGSGASGLVMVRYLA